MTKNQMEAETLVRKFADMVYRLALLNMKNQQDAEDIFQEVFLRLVDHLHKLHSEEHVKAWLLRVTVNCCKKQFQSAWRRKTSSLGYDMAVEWAVHCPEDYSEVYEAVRELPEKYRNVIHLFYFEDLPVKTISRVLKIGESTVKSQLFRGRDMLKSKLKGAGHEFI